MNTCVRLGSLAAALFLLIQLSGCGSSTTNTVPTVEPIFYAHSVVFDNNSTLLVSGYNGFGQLGLGTLDTPQTTVQHPLLVGRVRGYAAGANHTLAFANDSTMWAWGSNLRGRLGVFQSNSKIATIGQDAFTKVPILVHMTNKVVSIATGWNHSLAVAGPNRSVKSWGANNYGQLGNNGANSFADYPYPTDVLGDYGLAPRLENVVQVAAGGSHSLALKEDGTVWAWGDNFLGQLGYTSLPLNTYNAFPKPVVFPDTTSKVKQIAAAGSFSVALKEDGTVWVWGFNGYGQAGANPIDVKYSFTPLQIMESPGVPLVVTKVSAGTMHILALKANGEIWSWGWNERGQLGLGHESLLEFQAQKAVGIQPASLMPGLAATDIYAFGNQSFARIGGKLYGWGDNGFGQLGQPIPTNSIAYLLTPVEYKIP